jgi:hypothetical protein
MPVILMQSADTGPRQEEPAVWRSVAASLSLRDILALLFGFFTLTCGAAQIATAVDLRGITR